MSLLWTIFMFASFGLAVLLAVGGWIVTLEACLSKEAKRFGVWGWLCFACVHTAVAATAWYVLAFAVRPFG